MNKSNVYFKSWSASRLDDYTLCPFMAMHKHLLKTCPSCFKGAIKKGEYPNQVCTVCGKSRPMPASFKRGGEIGENLEKYVKGKSKKLHKEITHPKIITEADALRSMYAKKLVQVEFMINLDRNFRVIPPKLGWTPDIWLIVKMDVWVDKGNGTGHVLDWKTGGVDKQHEIRANEKYDDQLLTYQVAGLCYRPELTSVSSALGFIDARDDIDPFVPRDPLPANKLERAKKHLQKLALPIMSDRTFAPRPNDRCRFCDFRKTNGGPCQYS